VKKNEKRERRNKCWFLCREVLSFGLRVGVGASSRLTRGGNNAPRHGKDLWHSRHVFLLGNDWTEDDVVAIGEDVSRNHLD